MSLTVEKTWLMDYGILRRVNQCRRLMQVEFGVKPALHDPQLPDMLAHYAGRTRQKALQECYAELRSLVMHLDGEPQERAEASEAKPRRMYRGRPLADDLGGGTASAGSRTVIYRGRVLRTD